MQILSAPHAGGIPVNYLVVAGGGAGGSNIPNVAGIAGTSNTGGGGGCGGEGANGGSGIVIIRYSGAQAAGGGTYSSSGGNSIHTFTGDGTFSTNTSIYSIN